MAHTNVTINFDVPRPERISRNYGLLTGQATIGSYDTATSSVALTSITGRFKNIQKVIADGMTTNGYAARWSASSATFRAYYPNRAASYNVLSSASASLGSAVYVLSGALQVSGGGTLTMDIASNLPGTEVGNGTNIGTLNFAVIGII